MNPAEKEIRIWAWNCGAAPLSMLAALFEGYRDFQADLNRVPTMVERIAKQQLNSRDSIFYQSAKTLIEDVARSTRLVIKLPKTLAALRRESHPFQRIERDLYREFLRYNLEVAESMLFALKVGIFQFVHDSSKTLTESVKSQLLKAWKQAANRAGEDFSRYRPVFQAYLDNKIDSKSFVNKVASVFFDDKLMDDTSTWIRFFQAVEVSPNIAGVGIDLKKLMGMVV